ncbi:5'/3'-nucleotidase SurE [Williamsia deligens]|uniref:5'-nucleotidase SurE n=1 Tax=Williamsia deligens TaxID=321325 RepID=A0ABW3G3U9_9NOCA|nr:5'/3'-nucleotidase SurE [Williamsia deligens]MCP2194016.1 5'-nucleotidase /3'-nucleotidase /exopolyphosphatase [Williamsia deligens]
MSLRILLTNDDGWEAPGIGALAAGLRSAGHDVVVVAPATNQSGASARISSSGKLTVTRPEGDDGAWAVEGSPADSVIFGLTHVFDTVRGTRPDVVVSGANAGANAGQAVHFSGTVGAAVCATGFGIPAVAVSTHMAWDLSPTPDLFDDTVRAVTALLADRTPAELVPTGSVLNVNIPNADAPRPLTASATRPDHLPMGRMGYTGEGTEFQLAFEPGPDPEPGTDTAVLRAGRISLSVVPVVGTPDVADHLAEIAAELTATLSDHQ